MLPNILPRMDSSTPSHSRPPTLDPVAAARWAQRPVEGASGQTASPWLHEEVARRMAERLSVIVKPPQSWLHWEALTGGLQGHTLVRQHYPEADSYLYHALPQHATQAQRANTQPWWSPQRWRGGKEHWQSSAETVEMVWANMALHWAADPLALLQRWHSALAVNGFVMFSCLGPDTLRTLSELYARMGWGPLGHALTDMHDWGDMLVQTGFAEPVMDMERIDLSYSSAAALIDELRTIGRNAHVQRYAGLRTPRWRTRLEAELQRELAGVDGRLHITLELVYGHAYKPQPRLAVQPQTAISLEQMRSMLKQ